MFNHIIKFYIHRRNTLRAMGYWNYRRNDGMIHGYIQAARVFNMLGISAADDSRVKVWAGRM